MKQKKHLIILFTALITLSSYAVFYAKDFFQYANEWNLFSVGIRIWDFNLNLIFILLLLLILPNILLYNIFALHENGAENIAILRIGIKKFHIRNLKKLLAESFLSISLLHCFILLGIYFVYHPSLSIHFIPDDYLLFFKNPIINYLLFSLFRCLGFTLFIIFVYVSIFFIKRRYFFHLYPLLIMIGSVVLVNLVIRLSVIIFQYKSIPLPLRLLTNAILPTSLICPGMSLLQIGYLNYLSAFIFYIFFISILYVLLKRWRKYLCWEIT